MNVSLRLRLIGATTLLLVLVVALFGILQVRSTTSDLSDETTRLRTLHIRHAENLGRSTVETLSAGAHFAIAENDFPALRAVLVPAVKRAAQTELPVKDAWISNEDGEILAFAAREEGAEAPKQVPSADIEGLEKIQTRTVLGDKGLPREVIVAAPIADRTGKVWGFTRFEYDLEGLRADLKSIEDSALERKGHILLRTGGLGGLVVFLGIVVAVLQSIAISRPIINLTNSAQSIAAGDLSTRAEVGRKDEIGDLAHNFNLMASRVEQLLQETAAKTALERELQVARVIQETLLPDAGLTRLPGLSFAGYLRSASICGGDFWSHASMGAGRHLLCVGDVTGHGVPSAMITAACKSGLDTVCSITQGQIRIESLLAQLNHTILEAARRKFAMTFLGGIYDLSTRRITLSNAGHNFPLLVRNEHGKFTVRPIVLRGNRLGDQQGSQYTAHTEQLYPGDMLCFYTDGITEFCNAKGKMFGERRLGKVLERVAHMSPDLAIKAVLEELHRFTGETPQDDDVTLVLARVER